MDWSSFLTEYSRELASCSEYLDWAKVPQYARDANWFGNPPATAEQFVSAEKMLQVSLRQDLREFCLVTNGWMLCGSSVYDIRPVEELQYLTNADPSLWSICAVDGTPPVNDPVEYEMWYEDGIKVCRSIVLNTRGDDSTFLFDSESNLPDNEFRYGTFAAWNPGMEWVSPSFAQYFQEARKTLIQITG